MKRERPNFRIVENDTPFEIDYDAFLEDFGNPYMTVKQIKEKYGMSKSQWKEYRAKALKDLDVVRKPCYTYGKLTYIRDNNKYGYIQKKTNGWIIVKKFGRKSKYYGRYDDLKTAEYVRDRLVECDWHQPTALILMNKYSASKRKIPPLERAKRKYDEFEELYLHSEYTIVDILEKLDINREIYQYLLQMVWNNHNIDYRPSISERCSA